MAERTEILVSGGDADPNLACLCKRLEVRGIAYKALLVGSKTHPRVTWDLESNLLQIDGQSTQPSAAFLRPDVFTSMAEGRPEPGYRASAWHTTIQGWVLSHRDVRMFNRESAQTLTNKLYVLSLAKELGLAIPSTLISNDRSQLEERLREQELVVKPTTGGDFARHLSEVLPAAQHKNGALPAPAIVQERLVSPDVRVYGIGGRFLAFQLISDALDYRTTKNCKITVMDPSALPDGILERLQSLMDRLQLTFGAADFKVCSKNGKHLFLEINNGPMFAAFDHACEGRLTDAMADFLVGS